MHMSFYRLAVLEIHEELTIFQNSISQWQTGSTGPHRDGFSFLFLFSISSVEGQFKDFRKTVANKQIIFNDLMNQQSKVERENLELQGLAFVYHVFAVRYGSYSSILVFQLF